MGSETAKQSEVDGADGTDGVVRGIVAEIAGLGEPGAIAANADVYRDLGVKSTAALDLLITLEERLGVVIPDESFGDARTINALTALVRNLL
ncbi:MAG TPA: acyl carrier protein [Kofleriaceae bacterium]|nr:acyl carrier protein [Kofleriaceae bacterium]